MTMRGGRLPNPAMMLRNPRFSGKGFTPVLKVLIKFIIRKIRERNVRKL